MRSPILPSVLLAETRATLALAVPLATANLSVCSALVTLGATERHGAPRSASERLAFSGAAMEPWRARGATRLASYHF